jgi:chaperone required for assembly of F1-ATPase
MKRFYSTAAVVQQADGYALTLDGKLARTPARNALAVPGRALADAICAEWRTQGEVMDIVSLRLTRLANTAIDRVNPRRDDVITEVVRYAETDLVCYRATEPAELVGRQNAGWSPLLDWLSRRYQVRLSTVNGVVPTSQPLAALARLRGAIAEHDAFTLTALHAVTAAAGSLVIGLALAEKIVSAEQAFDLSQIDETFQTEKWGEDAEASLRRTALRADILTAAQFMELCRG